MFYRTKVSLSMKGSLKKDLRMDLDQSSLRTGITTLVIGSTGQCRAKAAT